MALPEGQSDASFVIRIHDTRGETKGWVEEARSGGKQAFRELREIPQIIATYAAQRSSRACYRKLHRWKYQLMDECVCETGIAECSKTTQFLELSDDGRLEIKNGYAWDGPSGPTIGTSNFMRSSLIHDALYQLIRLGAVPYDHRRHADSLLRKLCREDGMSRFRAWYVYVAVRLFGGSSATPGTEKPVRIRRSPARG